MCFNKDNQLRGYESLARGISAIRLYCSVRFSWSTIDFTVLSISIAVVSRATPPGTGVMHPALPMQLSRSASPTSSSTHHSSNQPQHFPLLFFTHVVPTSIMQQPGFSHSLRTSPGHPTAVTRMSALEAISSG